MCKWKPKRVFDSDTEYVCDHPEHASERCLLHFTGTKETDKFVEALRAKMAESDEASKYDFTGFSFPLGVIIENGTGHAVEQAKHKHEGTEHDVLRIVIPQDWTHKVSFREARIPDLLSLRNLKLKGSLTFRSAVIDGPADFRNLVVEGWTSFAFTEFAKKVYAQRWQIDISFGKRRPNIFPFYKERRGVTLKDGESASDFWRFARLCFELQGERDRADAAFYFERLTRISPWTVLDDPSDNHGVVPKWVRRNGIRTARFLKWIPDSLLLRWPTAYGASLARLAGTLLVLVGGFGVVYRILSLQCPNRILDVTSAGLRWPFSLGRALYLSVTTFTTLGFGDFRPAPGLGSALCATEAILGGITMALTVLVIGRKFMR